MKEFKYNNQDVLTWKCENCLVFENGELKENPSEEIEVTKNVNYSLQEVYNKEYSEEEKNINNEFRNVIDEIENSEFDKNLEVLMKK